MKLALVLASFLVVPAVATCRLRSRGLTEDVCETCEHGFEELGIGSKCAVLATDLSLHGNLATGIFGTACLAGDDKFKLPGLDFLLGLGNVKCTGQQFIGGDLYAEPSTDLTAILGKVKGSIYTDLDFFEGCDGHRVLTEDLPCCEEEGSSKSGSKSGSKGARQLTCQPCGSSKSGSSKSGSSKGSSTTGCDHPAGGDRSLFLRSITKKLPLLSGASKGSGGSSKSSGGSSKSCDENTSKGKSGSSKGASKGTGASKSGSSKSSKSTKGNCACHNPSYGKIPAALQLAEDIKKKKCTAKFDKRVTAITVNSGENVLCFDKGADLKNLVITGPADAKVYINVSFMLKVSGKVTLAGGIVPKMIIWNIGSGHALLDSAEVCGSILASRGKIELKRSKVLGAVVSLKEVSLMHDSIVDCAKPSYCN